MGIWKRANFLSLVGSFMDINNIEIFGIIEKIPNI